MPHAFHASHRLQGIPAEGDPMKKLTWGTFFLVLAAASYAQEQGTQQADFMMEYSHLEVLKGYTISMNGASTSAAYNLTNWLGVAGDFGSYHGYPSESLTGETFTLGPRLSYRRSHWVQPFAEGLAGGSHFNLSSGGITGGGAKFTPGAGAGADIALGHQNRFAVRLQRDYFWVRSSGSNTICDRLSAGIDYRFGAK
jgi:hypothetical protein